MPVRKDISYSEGLFFITFTCYKWLPLIEQTNGFDLVYSWFDYLEKQNHRIAKSKHHEVREESFDWKLWETASSAYQKLIYMHNNPCSGKWKIVEDITKNEHSSARFYISGKHAAYQVTDVEEILCEKLRQSPESAPHRAGL